MPVRPAIFSLVVAVLACAFAASGCGEKAAGEPLTISFQAPSSGPLVQRASDMRRGAVLALEAIDGEASGHPVRLVLGPVPGSIATIDALSSRPKRMNGQLLISLAPPARRQTASPATRIGASRPQVWLAPPQAEAERVTRDYARSGASGARGTAADSPLIAGTPSSRYVTAALSAHEYPPAGSEFFDKFNEKYGRAPDRWAIYGYEAVGLVVDAISRLEDAGIPLTKRSIAEMALSIRGRYSPLGHYDVLPSGQSTLYVFQARGQGAPIGPASLLEAMR